jgi:hypothetical protein
MLLLVMMLSWQVRQQRLTPKVCRRSWCVAYRVCQCTNGCVSAEGPFPPSKNATTPPTVNLAVRAGIVQLRGRRRALVVGVCRYEDPSLADLPASQTDAEWVAKLLAGFGYTVDVLLNATRA